MTWRARPMSSTRLTWSRILPEGKVVPPLQGAQRPVARLLSPIRPPIWKSRSPEVRSPIAFACRCGPLHRILRARSDPERRSGTRPLPVHRDPLVAGARRDMAGGTPAQPKVSAVCSRDHDCSAKREHPLTLFAQSGVADDGRQTQGRQTQKPESDDGSILVAPASQPQPDGTGGDDHQEKETMKQLVGNPERHQDRRGQDNQQRPGEAVHDAQPGHRDGNPVETERRRCGIRHGSLSARRRAAWRIARSRGRCRETSACRTTSTPGTRESRRRGR